jgi:hypothetical protein
MASTSWSVPASTYASTDGASYVSELYDDGLVITQEKWTGNPMGNYDYTPIREHHYFDTWDIRALSTFVVSDNECLKKFAIQRIKLIKKHGVHRGEGMFTCCPDGSISYMVGRSE